MSEGNGDELVVVTVKRKTRKVKIEGDDGTVRDYTLMEMMGKDRDVYNNDRARRWKTNDQGVVVGVTDLTNQYSALISLCLYDETGKRVPEMQVQTWPVTAQEVLHEACLKINGFGKYAPEEIEAAKKNSSASDTSGTRSPDDSAAPSPKPRQD
jgi:hypothetical protein